MIKAHRAYLGLFKALGKVKPLYDAVVLSSTAFGAWKILITWYDSTNEGTHFRVRRDLEQLTIGKVEPPNEYLLRTYVLAEQIKKGGVDWPYLEINQHIARSLSSVFSIENRMLAMQTNWRR